LAVPVAVQAVKQVQEAIPRAPPAKAARVAKAVLGAVGGNASRVRFFLKDVLNDNEEPWDF
jgi:hypothetical protein